VARWRGNLQELTLAQIDAACARARLDTSEQSGVGTAGPSLRGPQVPTPPLTNRGGKARPIRLVCEDGNAVEIPARRGWDGGASFIDYFTFTCQESSFAIRSQGITDREVMTEASFVCHWIFGFGITDENPFGQLLYQRSYRLGDGYGIVCHGGQRNTVCVSLTGSGCAAAKEGWEGRLFWFLSNAAENPRITRVDMAHDDYEGVRPVELFRDCYLAGWFSSGGRLPTCEMRGNWLKPNGSGRTFYVGKSDNGKLVRFYEKGKQLGDCNSPWVRVEGELRSRDREIPFDVLLNPAAYLAGMYPALDYIEEQQIRVKTTQKSAQITYDKAKDWIRKQCGAYLSVIAHIEGGVENLLQAVGRSEFPKRLCVPDWETVGRQWHDPDFATIRI